jgi:hypothetical protein
MAVTLFKQATLSIKGGTTDVWHITNIPLDWILEWQAVPVDGYYTGSDPTGPWPAVQIDPPLTVVLVPEIPSKRTRTHIVRITCPPDSRSPDFTVIYDLYGMLYRS